MTGTALITLLISVCVLAGISILIGIINWVHLVTNSSSINKLQTEVDEAFKSLISRKKEDLERSTYHPAMPSQINEQAAQESIHQEPQQLSGGKQQEIEIFRNVRTEYADSAQASPVLERHQTESLQNSNTYSVPDSTSPFNDSQQSIKPQPEQHFYRESFSASQSEPATYSEDVLEVVAEPQQAAYPPAMNRQDEFTIPLYSKASKDADFQTLWRQLVKIFQTVQQPRITIDFRNVLFLYDKEIDYLRQVLQSVTSQKGTMLFSHCSPELVAIFNNDPILYNHIQQEEQ